MKCNKPIRKHRKWTALLLAVLMMTAIFAVPHTASAAVEAGQTFVSLGEDLSPEGRAEVLRLFGLTEADLENCTVITVKNQEEHEMFDSYLPQSVIGNVSISSSMITTREEGYGIQVRTENINWCTVSMYQNALATAGIKDADVVIASPGGATGSAALVGVTKAYSEITGESLKAESIDAAAEELILTGEVGDEIGDQDKAAELIASVKEAVASEDISKEEIEDVIDEAARQLDIDPSNINTEDITGLMEKIGKLDLDSGSLREQAGSVYDKLKEKGVDLGISKEQALNWFQKLVKWFQDLWNRYVG